MKTLQLDNSTLQPSNTSLIIPLNPIPYFKFFIWIKTQMCEFLVKFLLDIRTSICFMDKDFLIHHNLVLINKSCFAPLEAIYGR